MRRLGSDLARFKDLSANELFVIQKILYGEYEFSPLRLTIRGDVICIEHHPDDSILISVLNNLLRDFLFLYYYDSEKLMYDYADATVSGWRDLEAVVCVTVTCSYKKMFFNKRLIKSIRPILNNDKQLVDLVSSYFELPVLDLDGNVCEDEEVVQYPMGDVLSHTLFNNLLIHVSHLVLELYPDMYYVRYSSNEFLFPIYDLNRVETTFKYILNVFKETQLCYPSLLCAFRGGEPIKIDNGLLQIVESSGKCRLHAQPKRRS